MTVYLGDAVYVKLDPSGQLRLFTTDGRTTQNEIFLEPEVYRSLEDYVKLIREMHPELWGKKDRTVASDPDFWNK